MAIYLDSANHQDIREAMAWGFIAGITTNPALLSKEGDFSLDAIKPLCELVSGQVFYQLTSRDSNGMLLEAQAAFAISPSQVVLKIPCSFDGLRVVARLSLEIPCAVTAIFSPSQAYMAQEVGARYVLPYVNRSTRLMGDGPALVESIAAVLNKSGDSATEIIACSIKSPSEAVQAIDAGAHHLSLPLNIIRDMANHPLSDQAILEFGKY